MENTLLSTLGNQSYHELMEWLDRGAGESNLTVIKGTVRELLVVRNYFYRRYGIGHVSRYPFQTPVTRVTLMRPNDVDANELDLSQTVNVVLLPDAADSELIQPIEDTVHRWMFIRCESSPAKGL